MPDDPRRDEVVRNLMSEISETRRAILGAEQKRLDAIDDFQRAIKTKSGTVGEWVDKLQKIQDDQSSAITRMQTVDVGAQSIRDSARGLLELKHQMRVPKSAPDEVPFNPNETELEEAEHAVRGLRHLFKCTSIDQLPLIERKALTSFNMGASGFVLQPEMSARILSCLTDITDVTGLVNSITISAGSWPFVTRYRTPSSAAMALANL